MTQAVQEATTIPAETLDQLVADYPKILTAHDGRPLAALINYQLYLALQENIEEWYADQRAIATYERYLRGESTTRPWSEIKAELIAEGRLDAAESTLES
jgi:hypothetical protein